MMGAWITTLRKPPPAGQTIMVRFGAIICDAYFSKYQNKWFMLAPQGSEREIDPPTLWFDPEAVSDDIAPPTETPRLRRSKKPQQLGLGLMMPTADSSHRPSGGADKSKEAA